MLRPALAGLALGLFILGCATPPAAPTYKQYPALDETMSEEVAPVVEETLPRELNKDPEAIDFGKIQADAKKAAYYFTCTVDPSHEMFEKNTKVQASAKKAADWFAEIAVAAMAKDQAALVRLYGQKSKICTLCHD